MKLKNKEPLGELLYRSVEAIYPSREELKEALSSGKKIKIYLGIDPSGSQLHIGHSVPLFVMKRFQESGHKVILLIGSFTAQLGDPTGRIETRKPKTLEEVMVNARNYKEQASHILNFASDNPVEIKYNHEWLSKMNLQDAVSMAGQFTVQQMIQRDMFQKRIKEGRPIGLHEFLYPVFQGYDSVAMDVDAEVGATEQTFNMLAGRTLLKKMKNKEKFVIVTKLLTDASGKKLGKSEGNAINMDDPPKDQYGKIMALSDNMIIPAFEICTEISLLEIEKMQRSLEDGTNPRDLKMRLAFEIVTIYHGADAAQEAQDYFVKTIQKKELPEETIEFTSMKTDWDLVDLLVESGLSKSKTEARRVITEGGVKLDGKTIKDPKHSLRIDSTGRILQKGKYHFVRVKLGI